MVVEGPSPPVTVMMVTSVMVAVMTLMMHQPTCCGVPEAARPFVARGFVTCVCVCVCLDINRHILCISLRSDRIESILCLL